MFIFYKTKQITDSLVEDLKANRSASDIPSNNTQKGLKATDCRAKRKINLLLNMHRTPRQILTTTRTHFVGFHQISW